MHQLWINSNYIQTLSLFPKAVAPRGLHPRGEKQEKGTGAFFADFRRQVPDFSEPNGDGKITVPTRNGGPLAVEGACATKKLSIRWRYRAPTLDESGLKSNRISVAQCRNTPGLPCVKGAVSEADWGIVQRWYQMNLKRFEFLLKISEVLFYVFFYILYSFLSL